MSGPIEFTSPFVHDLDLALALPALRFRYSISISDMDVLLWRSGLRISPVRSTFFSYRNTLLALRTHIHSRHLLSALDLLPIMCNGTCTLALLASIRYFRKMTLLCATICGFLACGVIVCFSAFLSPFFISIFHIHAHIITRCECHLLLRCTPDHHAPLRMAILAAIGSWLARITYSLSGYMHTWRRLMQFVCVCMRVFLVYSRICGPFIHRV